VGSEYTKQLNIKIALDRQVKEHYSARLKLKMELLYKHNKQLNCYNLTAMTIMTMMISDDDMMMMRTQNGSCCV
jgi:hypothetical protein